MQSDEHLQSGSQLESLYNQNTGNQISTETTMEESKQMSHKAPVANSSWPILSSNTSYCHRSARLLDINFSTYGFHETSTTYQYSVPIKNQYSTLTNFQETQSSPEVISSPNDKYPFRPTTQKYQHPTRPSKRRQHGTIMD